MKEADKLREKIEQKDAEIGDLKAMVKSGGGGGGGGDGGDSEKEIKKLKKLIKQYESAHQSAREEVAKIHDKFDAAKADLAKTKAELQLKEQLVKQLLSEQKK